jgi:ABC-2 type transport system ATP-binding protein
MGLTEKKNKKAADLSGGMKRRLNICLALIHDPEILILDEPEAGLDPQSRILVRDFIRNFGRQKTIVLTTHNMDEADRLANRVAIVDRGKLLLLDTPQNLKRSVGEGDVLELLFENPEQENLQQFIGKTRASGFQSKAAQEAVIIKHPNIVGFVPEVKKLAEENGLTIAEIKLRENTLEDVFIHLTGRNLRQ